MQHSDTILALATAPGVAAIAVIRLSGKDAITLVQRAFHGKDLSQQASHTLHLGTLRDGERIVDEVLVSIFREPHSYTSENVVEISCHGSPVVVEQVLRLMMNLGARLAEPGEFTKRAFLSGKFDLSQAEAVADLINAETDNARQAALNQMRGGFSKEIKRLRDELVNFASLIELELDFGEEDVEFAKRDDLRKLILNMQEYIGALIDSFVQGRVIKEGIPTVIAGKPNVGKSTLLNALLNEEKAIVSAIPGTTRDVIEDEISLGGIIFRFIDTAGLRETSDTIEAIGVGRTREQLKKASLILYLVDLTHANYEEIQTELAQLESLQVPIIRVANKMDSGNPELMRQLMKQDFQFISASNKTNLKALEDRIISRFHIEQVKQGDVIITNARHYQSLRDTRDALARVLEGMDKKVTGDFLAMDVRNALHHLGLITGQITTEDLLGNIFGKFCIGK